VIQCFQRFLRWLVAIKALAACQQNVGCLLAQCWLLAITLLAACQRCAGCLPVLDIFSDGYKKT
jgi:hypothetical protein